MRDSKEIQAELDAAQADLETNIGQLKEIVESKLETPKQVVEGTRDAVSFVMEHKWLFLAGAAALWWLFRDGDD